MDDDLYTQGYQDAMQGLDPATDNVDYMRGYMDAPRDRDSDFADFTTDFPDLG